MLEMNPKAKRQIPMYFIFAFWIDIKSHSKLKNFTFEKKKKKKKKRQRKKHVM